MVFLLMISTVSGMVNLAFFCRLAVTVIVSNSSLSANTGKEIEAITKVKKILFTLIHTP